MSKLSFRARALDATKPMPVYRAEEVPDLPDFAAINRAVPQMPTGMEREEETEHHLQRALSAQQVYGSSEKLVIPIPDIDDVEEIYYRHYKADVEFKPPKQYVHVQAFGMDQEIPDYDMDSEDETWLTKQAKKMEVTPLQFENMMDRLEKGSGQMVVTLQEAKALLKEDDDLIIAVYDYWLNKRLRTQHALIPQVKTEKRDGSTTNNPYVAFRRRTEKMQTRKNRKNDESSYEKMLKLRRDLNKALTILELMKRREKSKKELLQLTIEIVDKRYTMQDWAGQSLAEAMAKRHTLPSYMPLQTNWATRQEPSGYVRKKREYKKRKHKTHDKIPTTTQPSSAQLPQYSEVDVLQQEGFSSDEEVASPPMSPSDQEAEEDPDGIYAFRRKAGCLYHAPISDGSGNWPWCGPEEGGFGEKKYRYSLTSLSSPRQCIGFGRRRFGRGGRLLLDRGFTDWDDHLMDLDLSGTTPGTLPQETLYTHIKNNNFVHFRPKTPTLETESAVAESLSSTPVPFMTEFTMEDSQSKQEQPAPAQKHPGEQLLRDDMSGFSLNSSYDMSNSFSLQQPAARFAGDSSAAHFAASAVCSATSDLLIQGGASSSLSSLCSAPSASSLMASSNVISSAPSTITSMAAPNSAVLNGPVAAEGKSSGFSTSPAATVLQLNFPLGNSQAETGSAASCTSSSMAVAATSATTNLSASSSLSSSQATGAVPSPSPVHATKAITPASPTHLKLAQTPNNSTIPSENLEPMNSVVKDTKIVEVT